MPGRKGEERVSFGDEELGGVRGLAYYRSTKAHLLHFHLHLPALQLPPLLPPTSRFACPPSSPAPDPALPSPSDVSAQNPHCCLATSYSSSSAQHTTWRIHVVLQALELACPGYREVQLTTKGVLLWPLNADVHVGGADLGQRRGDHSHGGWEMRREREQEMSDCSVLCVRDEHTEEAREV